MNPNMAPIGRSTFQSNTVNLTKEIPPNIEFEVKGGKFHLHTHEPLSDSEIAVVTLLGSTIQQNLTSNAFLLTFDSRQLQELFSKVAWLNDINVDEVIGGLWVKTQQLVLSELVSSGNQTDLKSEIDWQKIALLRSWESIFNIFKYKYSNVDKTKSENGEEPPYRVVFTNRQAQALLFCADKITNLMQDELPVKSNIV